MKIPFFDYKRLYTDERNEILDIVDKVASKGAFILQSELVSFENNLRDYLKTNYVIGVANATDALELSLMAQNIRPGDEVICSAHTMLATASAVRVLGGVPIPVDIGNDNLIDPNEVQEAISSRTVGIIPTQLNGRTCDMDQLLKISEDNGLFVVEDAAQGLGSKYKDKFAGTFGATSCISFFPAKVLGGLGDGGAIIVNDPSKYETLVALHDHGRSSTGEVIMWGRNSRLDNINAAILDYKLSKYECVVLRRREIAARYNERLSHLEELKLPEPPSNGVNYDIFQNYEIEADNRDGLKKYLSDNGIGTLIQWGGVAIHQFKSLGFTSSLPKTEKFFKRCIMLPMNMFITNSEVDEVCERINTFYRG